ncbi:MAG: hypothetical protein J6A01_00490, partial [Proteobacteria bacterium]|nr:hypothetical protein [Pseudomonadota bacterium]
DVTQYACSIAVIPIKTTFNTYLRVAQFSTPLLPGMAEVRAKNNIYPPLSNNQRYNCNFLMDEFKENTFDTCAQPDEKADLIERFYDIDPSYRSSLTCAPKCRDPQNLYIKSDDFMQALVDAMSDIRAKVQLFFIESTVYIVFNLGNDALNPHDDDLKNKKLNGSDVLLRVRNELDEMIPFCQKISDALEQLPEIA